MAGRRSRAATRVERGHRLPVPGKLADLVLAQHGPAFPPLGLQLAPPGDVLEVRLQVLPAGAAPGTSEKTLEFTRNKVTLEAQAAQKELRTIKRGYES